MALSVVTLFARCTGQPVPHMDYASPAQAYGVAHGQLAYYRALEQAGYVRIITDRANLDSHIAEWETWETEGEADSDATPPLGFVIKDGDLYSIRFRP